MSSFSGGGKVEPWTSAVISTLLFFQDKDYCIIFLLPTWLYFSLVLYYDQLVKAEKGKWIKLKKLICIVQLLA